MVFGLSSLVVLLSVGLLLLRVVWPSCMRMRRARCLLEEGLVHHATERAGHLARGNNAESASTSTQYAKAERCERLPDDAMGGEGEEVTEDIHIEAEETEL